MADRLTRIAEQMPEAIAVACPRKWSYGWSRARCGESGRQYATATFAELDAEATRIAAGLAAWGVPPATRLALLVRPGIEFVALVFGLLRAGMVIVLVDPGMGRRNLIRCLAEAEPQGFVAIGLAQAARVLWRHRFPLAKWNVTLGRRWFWRGITLAQLSSLARSQASRPAETSAGDPAAIIFTSGSTGVPKGVLYTQQMFDTQVAEIQSKYGLGPGGIDLACFPLFALFNSAMGVTTVLPEMDFSRPASADPAKLLGAARDWQVTQAFASPAVWRILGEHCCGAGRRIDSLRHVFSCGAPVPAKVLRSTLVCVAENAKMHTPYGATECLPIATIEAAEVLGDTAERTNAGAGVCVGRKFDSIEWKIIRITDEPIESLALADEVAVGKIGELIVRGPQVSPAYVTRIEANPLAKIADCGPRDSAPCSANRDPQLPIAAWHRTGDVGYFDAEGRYWYCGRKSQRVETGNGPLYTECVEAIINTHPAVRRSALVGLGPRGCQVPVVVVEWKSRMANSRDQLLALAQDHAMTRSLRYFLDHPTLPVDIRHNAKINREQLAAWASRHVSLRSPDLVPVSNGGSGEGGDV